MTLRVLLAIDANGNGNGRPTAPAELRVNVVVLDPTLPEALELLQELTENGRPKVLVLSASDEAGELLGVGHAGGSNGWQESSGARLTARELEVAELIDAGLSNKQIARHLNIEVPTVKNHVHHILEKLDVARRGEAAAQLRHRGVLPAPLRQGPPAAA